MVLVNPRITDFYGIHIPQEKIDFAIPFFDQDIPLYLDPFLLWKSPSHQDKSLHFSIVNALNNIGKLASSGNTDKAVEQLIIGSECNEVGMGQSGKRTGKRIGSKKANEILTIFEKIPQYRENGFVHFEEIQMYIDGISKDRISDFSCNFIKSFLIDYTIDQCEELGIPMSDVSISNIYDITCLLYTSPSPRDQRGSRMPSSA